MTTRIQKATLAMAAAALAISLVGYFALAPAAAAQTTTTTTTTAPQPWGSHQQFWQGGPQGANGPQGWGRGGQFGPGGPMFGGQALNATVGQTFTFTSTSGTYRSTGASATNGTASGTLTFTITGKLADGYTLSVTSGSVVVAGTTYTVSSGSAQMDRGASVLTGQGTTTPSGEFLLRASAYGSFIGSTGTVSLDLQSGSSEYLVSLGGSISS